MARQYKAVFDRMVREQDTEKFSREAPPRSTTTRSQLQFLILLHLRPSEPPSHPAPVIDVPLAVPIRKAVHGATKFHTLHENKAPVDTEVMSIKPVK